MNFVVSCYLCVLIKLTLNSAVRQCIEGLPREKIQIATKFGIIQVDGKMEVRGDAEYVRKACEESLERLGVDHIDLYYQHRVDTKVPIEVTVLHSSLILFLLYIFR